MAISDTKLRSLYGKPYSGPTEITDSDGLGIRITPKGVISFQFRFRWDGKQHRLGLGRYPAMTLRDARNMVADLRESVDRGLDPRVMVDRNNAKKKPTVKDCLEYWQENYVDIALREKTKALYKSTVLKHMTDAFPGMPIEDIPIRLWVERFTEEEQINPRRARQLLVQLRSAIGWCSRRQFISNTDLMRKRPATAVCDSGSGIVRLELLLNQMEFYSWKMLLTGELNPVLSIPTTSNFALLNRLLTRAPTSPK